MIEILRENEELREEKKKLIEREKKLLIEIEQFDVTVSMLEKREKRYRKELTSSRFTSAILAYIIAVMTFAWIIFR